MIETLKKHALPTLVAVAISGSIGWIFLETLDTAKVKAVTSVRLDSHDSELESSSARSRKLEDAFMSVAQTQAVTSALLDQLVQEARIRHEQSVKGKR